MKKLRIAILMHERDDEDRIKDYLIHTLAEIWQEDGHEVFFLFGTKQVVPADIIFVHVDLSVVPDSYLKFANRYPIQINNAIKDIRKNSYSDHMLGRHDSWNGRVIIKTNNNSAGIPERRRKGILGKIQKKTLSLIQQTKTGIIPSPILSARDYMVYNHLSEVPQFYFFHPAFVIQKFLPEKDGELFCTRILVFLGDKMKCSRVKSKQPIVNSESAVDIEYDITPDPRILSLRKKLGFDYGKFDYVIHNGEAILLDANKTIGNARELINSSKMKERVRAYESGLYSFLETPQPEKVMV